MSRFLLSEPMGTNEQWGMAIEVVLSLAIIFACFTGAFLVLVLLWQG